MSTSAPTPGGTSGDALQHVEHELGLLLRRARASSTRMAARVHPDLEPAAYPLLAHIAQNPDVRAREIAAHIGVGKGTMSRQLARLEELALVERRPDPEDSRGQLIRLTPEGLRRVEGATVARRQFLGAALGAWTDDEIGHLADQLARLNADLETAARRRTD
ncbi:MarR family winged helix-turn-helix transcriptional regulator [Cellulomonas sp. NPDC055163]